MFFAVLGLPQVCSKLCFEGIYGMLPIIVGVNYPQGWGGQHLLALERKVQPVITELGSIVCNVTGGLIGIVGCGLDIIDR